MSNIITAEGLEKLKSELKEIKEFKLKDVAVRIKDARDLGDLSENAEYHEAKNEQAFLHGRALDLEDKIKRAQVINKSCSKDSVDAGCKVNVENDGEKLSFEIVGSDESDPANGRISIDSPIGSALYDHKAGEVVTVLTPVGEDKYKIISIG
jgi:transcription elongation factor GreA